MTYSPWGMYGPPMPPPWMMPQSGNDWKAMKKFHKFMNETMEEFKKKEGDKKKNEHKARTYTILEVTSMLIIFGPFVGVGWVKLLQYLAENMGMH